MAVPTIGSVDLGPPISLTIMVRSRQTIADFKNAASPIALAMNVDCLEVIPLAPQWVRIVLLIASVVAVPDRSTDMDFETLRFGT